MKKKKAKIVARDRNILLHAKGELNLSTKVKKDKSKYSRKVKHKSKEQ